MLTRCIHLVSPSFLADFIPLHISVLPHSHPVLGLRSITITVFSHWEKTWETTRCTVCSEVENNKLSPLSDRLSMFVLIVGPAGRDFTAISGTVSLIANFESLSSPMTRVYLANESLTRNECHVGIQKLFDAINRDKGEKSRGIKRGLSEDSSFSGGFERPRDKSRSGIPREVLSTFSLERARTCRMWRRNPLGGTKKFSDPSRAPVGARTRFPSCCSPFEKISRVFVR